MTDQETLQSGGGNRRPNIRFEKQGVMGGVKTGEKSKAKPKGGTRCTKGSPQYKNAARMEEQHKKGIQLGTVATRKTTMPFVGVKQRTQDEHTEQTVGREKLWATKFKKTAKSKPSPNGLDGGWG